MSSASKCALHVLSIVYVVTGRDKMDELLVTAGIANLGYSPDIIRELLRKVHTVWLFIVSLHAPSLCIVGL